MTCPRCGSVYNDQYDTCTTCGASRVVAAPVMSSSKPAASAAAAAATTISIAAPTTTAPAVGEARNGLAPPPRTSMRVATVPAEQSDHSGAVRPAGVASPAFARDTTRYLCAAVVSDSTLNNAVIRDLINDKHQALAFSPGVDTAAVLKYALAARFRRRAVDGLLGVEVLIFLYFMRHDGLPALFWGAAVTWLTVHVEMWDLRRRVRTRLRRAVYDHREAPEPTNPRLRARVEALVSLNAHENVSVGTPERPFPGFGAVDLERSSAIDITVKVPGRDARSFSVHELYERVERDLRALDLPGVHVAPRVVLDGRDLHHMAANGFEALLPDPAGPPATHADEHVIRALREAPADRARAYLAIRVTGWSGEVVVTYFVRFQHLASDGLLFVELSRTALAPLREEFHQFDRDQSVLQLMRASLRRTPRDAFGSLLRLTMLGGRWALLPLRHWLEADAIRRKDFAYPARVCARELAALPPVGVPAQLVQAVRVRRHHRRFQDVDREMYDTLIESKLGVVIADFLAEHGVAVTGLAV